MILNGKVAVITGGAKGLGRETAHVFARERAQIVILDQDAEAAAAVVAEINAIRDVGHFAVQVDVASADAVDGIFARIAAQAGTIDVLVNSAGIREIRDSLEIDSSEWERVLAVNLSGTFYCARAAARIMVTNGGGSIVNIASISGLTGFEKRPAYSASKAGVVGLTRSLSRDFGASAIRVNAICPGLVRTPLTESYFADQDFVRQLPITVPLGRAGVPADVAQVALFFASDMSAFVTGVALPVDGGFISSSTFDVRRERIDARGN
jgi:NAD(P)-dependent dehydrogenase (short-subunit alcohol dehydrogenase family)